MDKLFLYKRKRNLLMDIFILVLELIGAAAFAVSGAMTGIRKNMDIFGAFVLALTVAVGGGIIRDIILGAFPPAMFQNPIYALTAFLTCLIVFIPQVRDLLERSSRIMLLADSIGLGIFTVSGAMRAFEVSDHPTVFLAVFVGVITGVGGGLLRDVMAGDMPYIFVKHIYATASIIGALLFCALLPFTKEYIAMLSGAVVIVVIRLLASHYRWSLPKPGSRSADR